MAAQSDFYIKTDNHFKIKVNGKSNYNAKLRSYSDNYLLIEVDSELKINDEIVFQLSHPALLEVISANAKVMDKIAPQKENFEAFKIDLSNIDHRLRGIWNHFFEERLINLEAKDIMAKVPLTCSAQELIKNIVVKIQSAQVGSILITQENGSLSGIFTERDILMKCLNEDFLDSPISKYMTKNPVVVSEDIAVEEVFMRFRTANFRHLPIVKNEQLIGIISIRDLIRFWNKILEVHSQKVTRKYERAMGVIVHDLRNPIYTIKTINELVLNDMESPKEWKEQKFPEMIHRNCETMISLIDDLLDITSINSGKINLNLEEIDFRDLIEESIKSFIPTANAKNIKFRINIESMETAFIDKKRFDQVLQNLISNALKYSFMNSQIDLNLKDENDKIVFEVVDYGQGISKEEIDQVFDELCNISSKPTANEPSTGLGLSIVKKIVTAHNGSVAAESEPGKRTCFRVEVPNSKSFKASSVS